jgi:hypothetical protein
VHENQLAAYFRVGLWLLKHSISVVVWFVSVLELFETAAVWKTIPKREKNQSKTKNEKDPTMIWGRAAS